MTAMTRRCSSLLSPVLVLLVSLAGCGGSSAVSSPSPVPTSPSTATPSAAATSVASGVASDPADQTISVTVAGGKVTGAIERVEVRLGSRLRITVTSDVADEIHVHGYDLSQQISPGAAASIEFVADKPGEREVELEKAQLTLARLIVS